MYIHIHTYEYVYITMYIYIYIHIYTYIYMLTGSLSARSLASYRSFSGFLVRPDSIILSIIFCLDWACLTRLEYVPHLICGFVFKI